MRRRPLGIWVITVLQFTLAVTLLLAAVTNLDILSEVPGRQLGDQARVVYGVWVAITGVTAALLWRLSRRGWVLTMVLTGLSLTANLALWWAGEANYLRLGLQAVVAFYLNSAPVRELFLRRAAVTRIAIRDDEGA